MSGLGRHVNHLAAPGGSGNGFPGLSCQGHLALVGVEIGDGAHQDRLAGTRRTAEGDALALGQFQVHGLESGTGKMADY